jgi:hypothetical protein
MADRFVVASGKDPRSGDITKLCNPNEGWSPRWKSEAISDIENGFHAYYVRWTDMTTQIHVVHGPTGKYLRTDRDRTERNNLQDLPDC